MVFSKMCNKCFQNAPDNFDRNEPEKYSSDNFAGAMVPAGVFNTNCNTFYFIDYLCVGLTAVASCGVLGIIGTIGLEWWNSRKTNVKSK